MNRSITIVSCMVVLCCMSTVALGWGSFPGDTHYRMANEVLSDASLQPYVSQFGSYGLSTSGIRNWANVEPASGYHLGWGGVYNRTYNSWSLTDQYVGYIVHVASDLGNSYHWLGTPGWLEYGIEGKAELIGVPNMTSPYTGGYYDKMNQFYSAQTSLNSTYASWAASKWFPTLAPTSWVEQGEMNGMRLAQACLVEFFTNKGMTPAMASPVPEPATIITLGSMFGLSLIRKRRRKRNAS